MEKKNALGGNYKWSMIGGVDNFGKGSFEPKSRCHSTVLHSGKIACIYEVVRRTEVINNKIQDYTVKNEKYGFPVSIYEN